MMPRYLNAVVSAIVAFTLLASVTQGQIRLHVDGDNGLLRPATTPYPGHEWSNAFRYLQDALAYADLVAQQDDVEIWLKGDTAQPYTPDRRTHDFSQVSGSFSFPEANCSGSWTDYIATFTITPWAGTGQGQPHTIEVEISDQLTLSNPTQFIQSNKEITGVRTRWLSGFGEPENALVRDFDITLGEFDDQNALTEIRRGPYSFRRGVLAAWDYAFFGNPGGSPNDFMHASFIDVQFLGGLSGSESTARVQVSSGDGSKLLVFGGKAVGPVDPEQDDKQCWRLHGVDDVVYVEHLFTGSEHHVAKDPDQFTDCSEYRVQRAFYVNCWFEGQNGKGSVIVGEDEDEFGSPPQSCPLTEAWFLNCSFEETPAINDNGLAYFLNCTLNGQPYPPNDPTTQSPNRLATFFIPDNVTIHGGFEGDEDDVDERPAVTNPNAPVTILTGDIDGDDTGDTFANHTENAYHVLTADTIVGGIELDRITVRGGNADGSGEDARGGGLLCENMHNGLVRLVNCDFQWNKATDAGGAVSARETGTATTPVLEVRESLLANNDGGADGGAIHSQVSGMFALRSNFFHNRADDGGAISSAHIEMRNCVLRDNEYAGEGGGLRASGPATLINSLIANNAPPTTGSSDPYVAGGAYFADTVTLESCTIADNQSAQDGAAFYAASHATLENTIVYFNENPTDPTVEEYVVVGTASIEHSCQKDLPTSAGNISDDPEFIQCVNVETTSNYCLDSTSPCRNAGDHLLVPLDGMINIDNDDSEDELAPDLGFTFRLQESDTDIGAYEYYDAASCPEDITNAVGGNPDLDVDIFDLLVVLQNWNTNGPGAQIAEPFDDVDVFDLLQLLSAWGRCGSGVDQVLSDDDCYAKFGTQWSQDLEDCLEAVAIAEGYLSE